MQIGQFARQEWDETRQPLADPAAEQLRRQDYLDWLRDACPMTDDAKRLHRAPDGREWVSLQTAAQADYESFHMGHGIGHSWDSYAERGQVFSLRDMMNLPEVTIMVAGGKVTHALRVGGEPLRPADLAAIRDLGKVLSETSRWTLRRSREGFAETWRGRGQPLPLTRTEADDRLAQLSGRSVSRPPMQPEPEHNQSLLWSP